MTDVEFGRVWGERLPHEKNVDITTSNPLNNSKHNNTAVHSKMSHFSELALRYIHAASDGLRSLVNGARLEGLSRK